LQENRKRLRRKRKKGLEQERQTEEKRRGVGILYEKQGFMAFGRREEFEAKIYTTRGEEISERKRHDGHSQERTTLF